MTIALVHGNPETAAIWDPLLAELRRDDVVALSPPGFGAPVPDGFGATSDDYLAWLIGEVEQLPPPVDLVGHDWGGGHVQRLAASRPDLIRSWATDIAGAADPEYVWHDMAQVWQTPGDGEAFVDAMMSMPATDRAAALVAAGMTPDAAAACAAAAGPDMGRCILTLYRSAAQPAMTEWGRRARGGGAPARPRDHRHRRPVHGRRGAGPPLSRAVRRRVSPCWMGSATGGCCRTRPGALPRSASSGTTSPDAGRIAAGRSAAWTTVSRCVGRVRPRTARAGPGPRR